VDGLDGGDGGEWGEWGEVVGCLERRGGGGGWKVFVTSQEGWGGALGVGEGCVRFLIGEDGLLRIFADMWRGFLGRMGPVDRMMLRELDLRAQVIDTLTLRAHARVSPCLDITSCARGMLRLELTSARFHWAALQFDQSRLSGIRKALRSVPSDIRGIGSWQRSEKANAARAGPDAIGDAAISPAHSCSNTSECGGLGHTLAMLDRPDVDGEMVKISREEVPDAGAIEECCTGLIAINLGSGLVTIARVDISQQMRK